MSRLTWGTAAKGLALVAALGFVFSVQYIPHLATFGNPPSGEDPGLAQLGDAWLNYAQGDREGFPWAIHVDEHYHMNMIDRMQELDRLIPWGPYVEEPGEFTSFGSLRGAVHERGYHVFMAQAQELTGVSTLHLYQFLPAAWMTFIAFAVYALIRPHPAAIPAAAFVGLVPTTLRFMGPGFLVPIGFSLAWLPVTAILTEPAKKKAASAALLLITVTWAFFVHLMAGFAAVGLVLGVALFSGGQARRSVLTLAGLALIPVAWLWRSFSSGVETQLERVQFLPIDFTIFDNFGIITLGLWALGLALIVLDPPEHEERASTAGFAALSGVAMALIVSTMVFDWNKYATYTRMHPIFFLTAAAPAGFAVTIIGRRTGQAVRESLRAISERWEGFPINPPRAIQTGIAVLIILGAAGTASSQAIGYHLEEPYYRVMTPTSWDAFRTADQQFGDEGNPYQVFLSHPWQAPFLTEMGEKHPHAVMEPGGPPRNWQSWERFLDGNTEPAFYVMNDVTLVVGPHPPPGDFWNKTGKYVYTMEEPYAEQIQRIRAGKSLQLGKLPASTQGS